MSLICFIAFLGAGIIGYTFRPGTPESGPKFPEIEWGFLDPVPQQIDQWWAVSFGGRKWFAQLYHHLNPDLKQLSPLPLKVIMGQEGWLFHADKPIAQFRNQKRFTDYELSVLRRKMQERISHYQQAGIQFELFILPNKSRVYPEYLPPYFREGAGLSQAAQVVDLVSKIEGAQAHFLENALRKAKDQGRLYDKTDTHWTDLGAYVGYEAIVNALAKDFPSTAKPRAKQAFEEQRFTDQGRNLARMLSMSSQYTEEAIRLIPQFEQQAGPYQAHTVAAPQDFVFADQYLMGYQNQAARGPKVLFIRDSFSTQMIDWLNEHFEESYFLWDQWRYGANHSIVTQIKPEVVVVVMLEEHLDNLLRWD